MPQVLNFVECGECKAKSESQVPWSLCASCVHNLRTIEELQRRVSASTVALLNAGQESGRAASETALIKDAIFELRALRNAHNIVVDRVNAIEKRIGLDDDEHGLIHCTKAGRVGHRGCGWCAAHNKPCFECLCNGPRATPPETR